MATWTDPPDWFTGQLVTAALMNAYVNANLVATRYAHLTYAPGSYQLALIDANGVVNMDGGGSVTVPSDATVAFPVGTMITVIQTGGAQVTIAAGAGASVWGNPGLKMNGQYAAVTLIHTSPNGWVAVGALTT